jgi:hypothetical protein
VNKQIEIRLEIHFPKLYCKNNNEKKKLLRLNFKFNINDKIFQHINQKFLFEEFLALLFLGVVCGGRNFLLSYYL